MKDGGWYAFCPAKNSGLQERCILAQKLFFFLSNAFAWNSRLSDSSCATKPNKLHPVSVSAQGFLSARCRRRRRDINSGANPRLAQKRAQRRTAGTVLSTERDTHSFNVLMLYAKRENATWTNVPICSWIFLEPVRSCKRNVRWWWGHSRCWDLSCLTARAVNWTRPRMRMLGRGLQQMLLGWLLLSVTPSGAGEGCNHLILMLFCSTSFNVRKKVLLCPASLKGSMRRRRAIVFLLMFVCHQMKCAT